MDIDLKCPLCGRTMELLEDTEWTDGRQRTIDVMCPNCLHRETLYLEVRRLRCPSSGD